VSVLRGAEPGKLAKGYSIHDNPRDPIPPPPHSFVRMALESSPIRFASVGGLCVHLRCTLDRIGPAQFSPQQLATCPQTSESLQRKS
jgi:hypothetical protein